MMSRLFKIFFFGFIIKPLVLIILGLNIRNREKLPQLGPAVIAGNHNSHLDTMVLMSLYPLSMIHKIRPVAAADYFLANKVISWFSLNVIGIIPLARKGEGKLERLFDTCHEALDNSDILIIFPEGSRGEPEQFGRIRKGLYHLIKNRQDTSVTPVVMHGLGKALPRNEALLVPFNCDVIVGSQLPDCESSIEFIEKIYNSYQKLLKFCLTKNILD